MLLNHKRIVVCGVANDLSIAWGITKMLKEQGATLALTCVEATRRRVTKLANSIGIEHIIACDVGNDDDIERAFQEIGGVFGGRLDGMIHSIAYARLEDLGGEFLEVNREGWRTALEISAYSLVAMAKAARPLMIAAGGGSIVTITFNGGRVIVPSYNVMGVAKAALECSMRYLSYDLGPDKIRVNAVSSGPIATMSSKVVDRFQDALDQIATSSPLLETVTQDDVGNACAFLMSDLSRHVTSEILHVDSGCDAMTFGARPHRRAAKPAGEAQPA